MKQEETAIKYGWRSGLEEEIAWQLTQKGVKYTYESLKIPWVLHRSCTYTPDFVLMNGVIIETKGRFIQSDRMKHIYIKKQHPDLDIRFIFSNCKARISKVSKTSYADWCDKHKFKWAHKEVPQEWLDE